MLPPAVAGRCGKAKADLAKSDRDSSMPEASAEGVPAEDSASLSLMIAEFGIGSDVDMMDFRAIYGPGNGGNRGKPPVPKLPPNPS